ncbi:unnamed protein product [Linum trigynum]|uniref:Uncharacterized protein n=1 Tax=Linum trigynum TaxID=586398 RepID=A0AAV2GFN5_9ROSI
MKKGEAGNESTQGKVQGTQQKHKSEPKEKKPPDGVSKGGKAKQSPPTINQERKNGGNVQDFQKEDNTLSRKIIFSPVKEGVEKEKNLNSKPSVKAESKKETGATAMAVDSK